MARSNISPHRAPPVDASASRVAATRCCLAAMLISRSTIIRDRDWPRPVLSMSNARSALSLAAREPRILMVAGDHSVGDFLSPLQQLLIGAAASGRFSSVFAACSRITHSYFLKGSSPQVDYISFRHFAHRRSFERTTSSRRSTHLTPHGLPSLPNAAHCLPNARVLG